MKALENENTVESEGRIENLFDFKSFIFDTVVLGPTRSDFWLFQSHSLFRRYYSLCFRSVFRPAQWSPSKSPLRIHPDFAVTAGGQHFHCAKGSGETSGTASGAGIVFTGSVWQAIWLLGIIVCCPSGCSLQKFSFFN